MCKYIKIIFLWFYKNNIFYFFGFGSKFVFGWIWWLTESINHIYSNDFVVYWRTSARSKVHRDLISIEPPAVILYFDVRKIIMMLSLWQLSKREALFLSGKQLVNLKRCIDIIMTPSWFLANLFFIWKIYSVNTKGY